MAQYKNTADNLNKPGCVSVPVNAIVRLRPCIVRERKGHFHCWGTFTDDDGSSINGVVEFEDGSCDWFPPDWIKFTDRAS